MRTTIRQRIGWLVPLLFAAACNSSSSSTVAGPSPTPPAQAAAAPLLAVTTLSPSMGVPGGGTMVQIVGTGLNRASRITFGTAPATLTGWSPNGTVLNVTTSGHQSGTVDVVVTTPDGQTARLPSAFTYGAAAPVTIDRISANAGPTAGGSYLKIRGSGFPRGVQVLVDGAAARVLYATSIDIDLVTSAHPAATVELAVSTPDGQFVRLPGGFTFVPPAFSNFNGRWVGRLGDEDEAAFSFTVRDDVLVEISCNAAILATTAPPSTRTGEFVVTGAGSQTLMTGALVRADHAAGLISLPGCTRYDAGWAADRQ